MQYCVHTTDRRVATHDMDKVTEEVASQDNVCEEDAVGLDDEGGCGGRERGCEERRGALELDEEGGVDETDEMLNTAGEDDEGVQRGDDVGGGLVLEGEAGVLFGDEGLADTVREEDGEEARD